MHSLYEIYSCSPSRMPYTFQLLMHIIYAVFALSNGKCCVQYYIYNIKCLLLLSTYVIKLLTLRDRYKYTEGVNFISSIYCILII